MSVQELAGLWRTAHGGHLSLTELPEVGADSAAHNTHKCNTTVHIGKIYNILVFLHANIVSQSI